MRRVQSRHGCSEGFGFVDVTNAATCWVEVSEELPLVREGGARVDRIQDVRGRCGGVLRCFLGGRPTLDNDFGK